MFLFYLTETTRKVLHIWATLNLSTGVFVVVIIREKNWGWGPGYLFSKFFSFQVSKWEGGREGGWEGGPMRGLGNHVISGPIKGLGKNCMQTGKQANRQTGGHGDSRTDRPSGAASVKACMQ